MSLIDYSGTCNTTTHPALPAIFSIPLILRVCIGFAFKCPVSDFYKKCYLQMALLAASGFAYNYWESYFSYLLFLMNLMIVILTLTTANSYEVPNYLELFNTLSFYGLPFTPLIFWASLVMSWAINVINNLTCSKFLGIILAFLQITSGILAFLAGNRCELSEFYVLIALSLLFMIIQAEVFKSS